MDIFVFNYFDNKIKEIFEKSSRKIKEVAKSSVYYGFKWRYGWNESSRVWSCITPNEKASERIDLGFHIFLNKKDALTVTIGNCGVICRKVYFKLEDVIATGTWDLGDERCVVVKKLFARFKLRD
jgi:hypothetical protein